MYVENRTVSFHQAKEMPNTSSPKCCFYQVSQLYPNFLRATSLRHSLAKVLLDLLPTRI